jgi:hypothetical protein
VYDDNRHRLLACQQQTTGLDHPPLGHYLAEALRLSGGNNMKAARLLGD